MALRLGCAGTGIAAPAVVGGVAEAGADAEAVAAGADSPQLQRALEIRALSLSILLRDQIAGVGARLRRRLGRMAAHTGEPKSPPACTRACPECHPGSPRRR
jgi:hypothetical protein